MQADFWLKKWELGETGFHQESINERIEVEVPRSATRPDMEDLDDRPGVVAWRKELAAGERWRITHQYEVSYPRDARLAEQRWEF